VTSRVVIGLLVGVPAMSGAGITGKPSSSGACSASYFKFLRLTKFKPTIPNKRNGNVTNRIGGSPLPFLTTMGIFDIG